MRHTFRHLAILVVFLFAMIGVGPTHAAEQNPKGKMLGVAPRTNTTEGFAAYTESRRHRKLNLKYHGGHVMTSSNVHSVFWDPNGDFSTNYKAGVSTYFTNVAADSGDATNVYSVGEQYHGTSGEFANYAVTNDDTWVLTDPYPDTCGRPAGYDHCVTDGQVVNELRALIDDQGLPTGIDQIYFMFLPDRVNTCSGGSCSSRVFCAYHSWDGSGSDTLIYANQPFAGISGCHTRNHPDSEPGLDDLLSVVSHEHNEAITDPTGRGWYDRRGDENADKCRNDYGHRIGSDYNQDINGGHYSLQIEWSNGDRGCRQDAT